VYIFSAPLGKTLLPLFDYTSRDTATSGSDVDVDVMVTFDGPATSMHDFDVPFYLENLLGCPVNWYRKSPATGAALLY